ncbi:hypothetical protein [Herbidospora mongoliensis]|uniref:hypothetical protein n=1 Tax=Herbidospora mongoliensis TaxID=688067 RepID=UPI00082F80EF|nr:hypothetical protein [Herbidospora mongoliensis]
MNAATRLRWRIAGGLLTVGFLGAVAIGFASAVLHEPSPEVELLASRSTESARHEYAFFEPSITVVNHSGMGSEVEVKQGETGRLVIEREISWSFDQPGWHESWDGRTLTVDAAPCPGCVSRYTITVPAGTEVIRR